MVENKTDVAVVRIKLKKKKEKKESCAEMTSRLTISEEDAKCSWKFQKAQPVSGLEFGFFYSEFAKNFKQLFKAFI